MLLLPAASAEAQQATDDRTGAMIAREKQVFGPPAPKPRCGTRSSAGEIVVCAPDDGKQWRVPSTAESDPTSREALRDGLPRAPQLDRGSCRGQPGCIIGGWAPPPVYMIDLAAIPEAPAGSDADKVAKGEMQDR
ncbi:MAG: hypothetical protein KGL44_02795 [Sphingomonadales bacterium]|nr:hypothetical protein [Sphingomonadales bacterium]